METQRCPKCGSFDLVPMKDNADLLGCWKCHEINIIRTMETKAQYTEMPWELHDTAISMELIGQSGEGAKYVLAYLRFTGDYKLKRANAEELLKRVNGFYELEAENAKLKITQERNVNRLDYLNAENERLKDQIITGALIPIDITMLQRENKRLRDALEKSNEAFDIYCLRKTDKESSIMKNRTWNFLILSFDQVKAALKKQ